MARSNGDPRGSFALRVPTLSSTEPKRARPSYYYFKYKTRVHQDLGDDRVLGPPQQRRQLSPAMYKAITDEAHKLNVPWGAHNVTLAERMPHARRRSRAGWPSPFGGRRRSGAVYRTSQIDRENESCRA